jgi:hypothetical protein
MAPGAPPHVPNDPIQARAPSMSVRGRTTRTRSPERKCLMLCVTRIRTPPPIAAARIGTSFASANSRARSRSCAVGRCIWTETARRSSSKSGAASGSFEARFRRTSATAASVSTRRRRPSSPRTRSRGWHQCGTAVRQSRRQHRHRRLTVQSSRAGPPRSFKASFRARRRRSISAASRGTTSTRGLRRTAPSRSTTVKGSPSPSRYFSRSDAGRVSVPRPRIRTVVVVIPKFCISEFPG